MIFFSYPAPLYEALKAVGGLSRQSVQLAFVVSSSAFRAGTLLRTTDDVICKEAEI